MSCEKDFDAWNVSKKQLNGRSARVFAHAREVWWCSLGLNVGSEIDGKHENFERPVLVLRAYGNETLLVLPLTTKANDSRFHRQFSIGSKSVWAALTQARVISGKRMLRKIGVAQGEQFSGIKNALIDLI